MSDSKSNATSGGVGFLGLLFIALLILKLTIRQDLNWWWVWAPIWGLPALLIVGLIIWVVYKIAAGMRKRTKLDRQIKDIETIAAVKTIPFEVALTKYAEDNGISRTKLSIDIRIRRMELWRIEHPNEPMPADYQPKTRWQQKIEELQQLRNGKPNS